MFHAKTCQTYTYTDLITVKTIGLGKVIYAWYRQRVSTIDILYTYKISMVSTQIARVLRIYLRGTLLEVPDRNIGIPPVRISTLFIVPSLKADFHSVQKNVARSTFGDVYF
jgi:hypothetical protein